MRPAEARTGEADDFEVRAAAFWKRSGVDGNVRDVLVEGEDRLAGDSELEVAQPRPGGRSAQEVGCDQHLLGDACVCIPDNE